MPLPPPLRPAGYLAPVAHVHRQHHTHHGAERSGHTHGHVQAEGARALRAAFFLNLAFTLVEVAGGWWTGSIAVLTDALHDAGDCLVLGTAWWLQRVALKGRDARYSYGYGRFSMLGGWLTSLVLIAGAVGMLVVSLPKVMHPHEPHTVGMIGIALFGLAMNGLAAWRLHGGATLNERGAYLHLLEDVLGWAAVLVGAVVIHFTNWAVVDPLMSVGISLFILVNAVGTLRRGTAILMQHVPEGIDLAAARERLLAIPHVRDLHDQHTWSLDGSFVVHTVHLVVADVEHREALAIKSRAREVLRELGIHHATIELEWENEHCGTDCH
ncbi:MAG: Cadmium, cobalt and zinc/H(+)-K(+) antiporter [Flavobacteriales bacterium]|nr:Cadmium, cobalt and zinc/H(+)-K(+) antiporter [Flavobacteriales bacterium]